MNIKKLGIVCAVAMLLILAVPAAANGIKPPPGEHFTFNLVTSATAFSDSFDGDLSQWTNI